MLVQDIDRSGAIAALAGKQVRGHKAPRLMPKFAYITAVPIAQLSQAERAAKRIASPAVLDCSLRRGSPCSRWLGHFGCEWGF
eukprot:4231991-Amphidinium_carterae.1